MSDDGGKQPAADSLAAAGVRALDELKESEERYRRLVELCPDGIAIHSEGRIVFVNRAATRLMGAKGPEELIGRPALDFVHPDFRAIVGERIRQLQEGQESPLVESRFLRLDGTPLDVEVAAMGFTWHGRPAVQLVARDITERTRVEAKARLLAEASRLLGASLDYETSLRVVARLLVPTFADWCLIDIVGEHGSVRRLAVVHADSARAQEARVLEGAPPHTDDASGVGFVIRTGKARLYPDLHDRLIAELGRTPERTQAIRRLGLVSGLTVPLLARGRILGALSCASSQAHHHYDPADLAFAENVAGRAAMAVDNARLYREVQEASRMKDEFLATLSHELRTPLTAIVGWSDILRASETDPETLRRGLECISRNARVQSRLIADILEVSRIVTGRVLLSLRPVDMGAAVLAALDSVRPTAQAKGVDLEAILEPEPQLVLGDLDRLQQIVWNLLSNAIKFTPRGGRVKTTLRRAGSQVELKVADTGAGIAPEFLPRVFERFTQADASTTRSHGGLGIGLAIVRHLAELHGGTADAESEGEGRGATFAVRLPLTAVRNAETAALDADARSAARRPTLPRLEGLRVLVVDDEPDTLDMLATVLRDQGASVLTARSGEEALEAVERLRPDVLVSDIGMPGEDGYELIRRVRALPPEKGGCIPAAALTAYAGAEDRMQALLAGFEIHVRKPVEAAELTAVVGSLAFRARRSGPTGG